MNVLSPWFVVHLLWIFPSIIILYFLKLRREEVVVPSVLLWRRTIDDMRVNAPFQKLTKNLLLFLQLLAAALLILAMMRPVLTNVGYSSTVLFILIDNSGSMSAVDESGRSRLIEAKAAAQELIEQMSRDDRAMIVAASARPQTLTQLTGDRTALSRAVADLQPTALASDFVQVARLVQGYCVAEAAPQVIIISDGAVPTDELTGEEQLPNVSFIQVGERRDNCAIQAVDALHGLDANNELQVTATLANYNLKDVQVPVGFYLDGESLGVRQAVIPAGEVSRPGTTAVAFDGLLGRKGALEVRIEREDSLAEDNRAFLDVRQDAEVRVMVVSKGDPFIQSALAADARVHIETLTPDAYAAQYDGPGGATPPCDVIFFDAWAPKSLLHPAAVFLGAMPPDLGFEAASAPVKQPNTIDQSYEHPLARFANFAPVNIASSLVMKIPLEATVLWETRETPVLAVLAKKTRRVVVSSISTVDSDWVIKRSWPLFVGNAVEWMAGAASATGALQHAAGDTVTLEVPAGTSGLTITTPDGRTRTVLNSSGGEAIFFAETELAGFYRYQAMGHGPDTESTEEGLFAVNFASTSESNPTTVETLDLPGDIASAQESGEVQANREVWRLVLLVLLGFLLAEWWYYHHRIGTI